MSCSHCHQETLREIEEGRGGNLGLLEPGQGSTRPAQVKGSDTGSPQQMGGDDVKRFKKTWQEGGVLIGGASRRARRKQRFHSPSLLLLKWLTLGRGAHFRSAWPLSSGASAVPAKRSSSRTHHSPAKACKTLPREHQWVSVASVAVAGAAEV